MAAKATRGQFGGGSTPKFDLPLCQNWCFYQKMHNRLAYTPHYVKKFNIMNMSKP